MLFNLVYHNNHNPLNFIDFTSSSTTSTNTCICITWSREYLRDTYWAHYKNLLDPRIVNIMNPVHEIHIDRHVTLANTLELFNTIFKARQRIFKNWAQWHNPLDNLSLILPTKLNIIPKFSPSKLKIIIFNPLDIKIIFILNFDIK